MGGLGKTTLAQLAYNDSEVCQQFDLKAWVCVSEDFDLPLLTRAMVESFTGEECRLSQQDALHIELQKKLAGKCFLLVLDDVWEKECLVHIWDRLRAPLLFGSGKSKIIVTTRSEEVSRIVGAVSTHHLPCLEGEHCLQLFAQRAFEGRDQALYPNLMAMAEKISKKCRGVPLVAKILGGQLRWEDDVDNWKDILEGEIWDFDKKWIMPVLRLSYDRLPPHLRKCFKYCSLFPKDYLIDRDELIRMWMAQGYLLATGTRHMEEDIGNDYFNDLVQRSFIQCSTRCKDMFQMHDLIHDLARLVSRGECYSWKGGSTCSNSEGDVQHLSIISSGDQIVDIASTWPAPQSAINLRSFLFFRTQQSFPFSRIEWYSRYKLKHLNDELTRMKHLRVLDLTGTDVPYLPDSVGCLKHLRYLAVLNIMEMPEWVGTLFHLQTLDFVALGSNLRCSPNSITQLLNLRHLTCHCGNLGLPAGIEKLTNLQTIPEFVWSSEPGRAKLSELKDLNNIRSLRITHLGELTDVAEAKKACLAKKERLRDLFLGWEHVCRPSPLHDQMLETLRPNSRLAELTIDDYKGQSVPTWLGDRSFSNMVSVRLDGCEGWTALPSLGWLPSLKNLHIVGASNVKYIGRQFFSGGFPRLEQLSLRSMPHWKSWCGAEKGQCPRLWKLVIYNCDELTSLSLINLEALQVLDIRNCIRLHFSKEEELPSTLEQFIIQKCPVVTLWCL
uniref:Putative disease resistance RPP13-like protein 1 n=1 Tax=Anthurium amnicola TaxID=1678845 RepID=A0A1D1Y4B1_9ARAE